eukprot:7653406-Pyramimonas_sp.AAC.1
MRSPVFAPLFGSLVLAIPEPCPPQEEPTCSGSSNNEQAEVRLQIHRTSLRGRLELSTRHCSHLNSDIESLYGRHDCPLKARSAHHNNIYGAYPTTFMASMFLSWQGTRHRAVEREWKRG